MDGLDGIRVFGGIEHLTVLIITMQVAQCDWTEDSHNLISSYLERNLFWVVERNVIPGKMVFAIQLQGCTSAIRTAIVLCHSVSLLHAYCTYT